MNNKFWLEHYGDLVGWTISSVAIAKEADSDIFPEGLYGLILKKGNKKKVAWILRDPEGNGEGFLEVGSI